MRKPKMPLQQENRHDVSKRQWAKWPDISQRVFNSTFEVMLDNPGLFAHPKAPKPDAAHWSTTAWNAAWIAADNVKQALKDIEDQVGYVEEGQ